MLKKFYKIGLISSIPFVLVVLIGIYFNVKNGDLNPIEILLFFLIFFAVLAFKLLTSHQPSEKAKGKHIKLL